MAKLKLKNIIKYFAEPKKILIAILILTAIFRFYNIWYPENYAFDEVYHAFTAKEFLDGNKEAWEWWTTPPPNVAFEWTHPHLAKELMALSMFVLNSEESWAYRLPGVIFGIISVYLIYLISLKLFNRQSIALLSSFVFSIDGLNFTQSRIGMNDIYFVTFVLATVLFFLKKNLLFSAIFFGLALSSKWTTVYLLGPLFILSFWNKQYLKFLYFSFIPLIIYLITYIPFFTIAHTIEQFIELQKQMWWYHTGLVATHDYSSPWWSWPFNFYPVWYFVDYHSNNFISNIFASGNPLVFWAGFAAIILSVWEVLHKLFTNKFNLKNLNDHKNIITVLLFYFAFWLPWAISPRIMFLYHYSPSIPFLSIALGYQLQALTNNKKDKIILGILLAVMFINFLLLYPLLVGIPLPKEIMLLFFETNITKNPFGN